METRPSRLRARVNRELQSGPPRGFLEPDNRRQWHPKDRPARCDHTSLHPQVQPLVERKPSPPQYHLLAAPERVQTSFLKAQDHFTRFRGHIEGELLAWSSVSPSRRTANPRLGRRGSDSEVV